MINDHLSQSRHLAAALLNWPIFLCLARFVQLTKLRKLSMIQLGHTEKSLKLEKNEGAEFEIFH